MRIVPTLIRLGLATCLVAARPAHAATPPDAPTPREVLAGLRLADPGLVVELVAAEPEVVSPVAMAWDEDGALYVAEMTDYPAGPGSGRVRRLEDADSDGRFERNTVFADGLPFANGVLPWRGGVLVTAAPDVWFLRDADGDGRADERRVVLTGFGEGNQQLRVNGLTWGLDNWVYGANGRSDGLVRRPDDPPDRAVSIARHDFRFRPDTGEFEPVAGFSQFGLPRDDRGNRFPSWNTVPIRHVVLEDRDLTRNPALAEATTVAAILDTTDGGRVYSLAPPQPRFNAESVAFFNASCGPTIYRDDRLGPAYRGNAFVCEPLTNLVHRRVLEPAGPTFVARRAEPDREFLASGHPWFHPVNLATGPDGALYVADFCRELVEHPAFVPESVRDRVDFRRGEGTGRIWRVRPREEGPSTRRPAPRLGRADRAALVETLGHPNGWWRDTAQRLLVERRDLDAVPLLEALAADGEDPLGRLHALWTLEGLGMLGVPVIRRALRDRDPGVREQALRLAGGRGAVPVEEVVSLADDPEPRVRFRCALALGDVAGVEAAPALARIAARDAADPWTRLAVLSGLHGEAAPFLSSLLASDGRRLADPSEDEARLLAQVGGLIGSRAVEAEIAEGLRLATQGEGGVGTLALLAGLSEGLERAATAGRSPGGGPASSALGDVSRWVGLAGRIAPDASQPAGRRALALDVLARFRAADLGDVLLASLGPDQPRAVQSAAARGLAVAADPALASRALDGWGRLPIEARRDLLGVLVRTGELAGCLLDAIEDDRVARADVDPATRDVLLRLPDPAARGRAARLLERGEASDRARVVAAYGEALRLEPDPRRGAAVFDRNCAGCHAWRGRGHRVGPDLSGVAGRPAEALIADILDPNREVAPDYQSYVVVTRGGRLLTGLVAGETASSLLLRGAEGAEESVLRVEIEEFRNSGRSLMPEGLEESLSPRDLADVIGFLRLPVDGTAAVEAAP